MLQLALLVVGIWLGVDGWRLRGERGRGRLARLDEAALRKANDLHVRGGGRLWLVGALCIPALILGLAFAFDRRADALAWTLTGAALVFGNVQSRRAAPGVVEAMQERGVESLPREVSDRRRRRVTQIGSALALCFLGGFVLVELVDDGPLFVVGAALPLVALLLLPALPWVGVWRYGDEKQT